MYVTSLPSDIRRSTGLTSDAAIVMTSPLVRHYMLLYGRPMLYSTALPHSHVCALNTTFDYVTGPDGVLVRACFNHS